MKINELKRRLRKDRPMATVNLDLPEDVIDDLKRIAPQLGFADYRALIRAYVGQGLRVDLERLAGDTEVASLIESLRRHGVDDAVIASAVAEAKGDVEAA